MRAPWLQLYTEGLCDECRAGIEPWGNDDDVINNGSQFSAFPANVEQWVVRRGPAAADSADPFAWQVDRAAA
jgi:hypothetical protein